MKPITVVDLKRDLWNSEKLYSVRHDNGKVNSRSFGARVSRLNVAARDVNAELNVLTGQRSSLSVIVPCLSRFSLIYYTSRAYNVIINNLPHNNDDNIYKISVEAACSFACAANMNITGEGTKSVHCEFLPDYLGKIATTSMAFVTALLVPSNESFLFFSSPH